MPSWSGCVGSSSAIRERRATPPGDPVNRPLELGPPGPLRRRLNDLVLTGHKVAGFALLEEYADEGEAIEHVGEELDLVDDDGIRLGTVRITDVRHLPFGAVDWGLVEAEGEGFATVADWAQGHRDYWASQGRQVDADDPVVWTRFDLIDPRPLVPPRPTAGDLELPEGYEHVHSGKVRDLFRLRAATSWWSPRTGSAPTTGCCRPRSPTRVGSSPG
ncbi:MAG: ASCH domain-containing protein [Candidatus Nanopelagicales bacterium]